MSELITIARPYALAAFDEAQKLSALSTWSDMLQSLSDATQDEQVRALIANPRVPKVQMENLMLAFGGTKLSAAQGNFIRILL
ncbi:MAG: F0F1 ATP synthase subunit delta, partial [Candidatus Nitrotoga sp.]